MRYTDNMSLLSTWQQWWTRGWLHRWHVAWHVPRFLRLAPEPIRGRVLEVGAGWGFTSRRILTTFPQVDLTATDINALALQRLVGLEGTYGRRLHVVEANVLSLPFDRGSFDVVLAINVFWRLAEEDVPAALRGLLRVLEQGGLLGISEHHFVPPPRGRRRAAIMQVITEEGCEVLVNRGWSQYDVWVRKPYPIKETQA